MMSTLMTLIARFGATSSIPTEVVAKGYFRMSRRDFLDSLKSGEIPCGDLDLSQIARGGIPLTWLADFIEKRRALAVRTHNNPNNILKSKTVGLIHETVDCQRSPVDTAIVGLIQEIVLDS